jgi:hypothetical protein
MVLTSKPNPTINIVLNWFEERKEGVALPYLFITDTGQSRFCGHPLTHGLCCRYSEHTTDTAR